MLERALNGIRMYPVPADVRRLMYKVKKAQGVDISRSFCGLNDHRNLELSVKYAREAGMISQAALSITSSPVHTVDYYMGVVDKVVEYGADEICLKDMAGVGRPATLGELVRKIKNKYPGIIVQYHGHSGPGMSVASMLEVARAGADYLDVAMEPLSWGMVHPDVIAVHAIMQDAGFDVPEINMDAYMKVRSLTQEFIDDFLGYFIDPRNRLMTSLLIGSGLPGGMMGSMMADLKGVHQGINSALKSQGKPECLKMNSLLAFQGGGNVSAHDGVSASCDTVQPVCQECGADEYCFTGEWQGEICNDRSEYLGHVARPCGHTARSACAGTDRTGEEGGKGVL